MRDFKEYKNYMIRVTSHESKPGCWKVIIIVSKPFGDHEDEVPLTPPEDLFHSTYEEARDYGFSVGREWIDKKLKN